MRQSKIAAIVFVVLGAVFVWRFLALKQAAKSQRPPPTTDAAR